jgi:hypothetical protein
MQDLAALQSWPAAQQTACSLQDCQQQQWRQQQVQKYRQPQQDHHGSQVSK